jgi:hypothetical protein
MNLNELLYLNLNKLYTALDSEKSERQNNQILLYANKNSIGTPDRKYNTGLDNVMPKSEFVFNPDGVFGFNNILQDKNIQQHLSQTTGSWNPNKFVFTPEGILTAEYSPWSGSPLNKATSARDRETRLAHNYGGSRQTPLRGASDQLGPYSRVENFTSAFWVSVTANGTPSISGRNVEINLDKSYFAAAQQYDSMSRPSDIKIYESDELDSAWTAGSGYTNINPTYYGNYKEVNFSLSHSGPGAYRLVMEVGATGSAAVTSGSYRHYLVCVGSSYTQRNLVSDAAITGSFDYKLNALRYISPYYQKTIIVPKTYDSIDIRGVYNDNQSIIGIPSSTQAGDVVVLANQTKSSENGMYVVSTGSWLRMDNNIPRFSFAKSSTFGLTGSKFVVSPYGNIFDAPEPEMKLVSSDNNNITPYWFDDPGDNYKSYNSINFTGSIYDSFGVDSYSYDILNSNSIGRSDFNYIKDKIGFEWTNIYVTPRSEVSGDVDSATFTEAAISTITGNFGTLIVGSEIVITSAPSNFIIAEVLYSQSNSAQILVKKAFGTLDSSQLILIEDFMIYGDFKVDQDAYYSLLEVYQSQLLDKLPELSSWIVKTYGKDTDIKQALVLNNDLTRKELQFLFKDESLIDVFAKRFGYNDDFENLGEFNDFGNISAYSRNAIQGAKVKPDVVFLSEDEEHTESEYELTRQQSTQRSSVRFIENSVTNDENRWQEFEFNNLDTESVGGELSTNYSSEAPWFTGSNIVRRSQSSNTRVGMRDDYGNLYQINETTTQQAFQKTESVHTSIQNKGPEFGVVSPYNYDQFWTSLSGSARSGLPISDTIHFMGEIKNPVNSIASFNTKTKVYSLTSKNSELVFDGKTVYIPMPNQDYLNQLKQVEVYAKSIGSITNNGFVRASIVDLTDFFDTNDSRSIVKYSSSNPVVVNYLDSTYRPIRFNFSDDSSWSSRTTFGQHIYLAIEKVGDFKPGRILFRCANESGPSLYQEFSGTRINTNLAISSTMLTSTGSSIYNLYHYLGNETTVVSEINIPNTFSTQYIRFPYFENTSKTSFNDSTDFVNVRLDSNNLTTGPPFITLGSAYGIETYSFDMYDIGISPSSGSKSIVFGSTGSTVSQIPKGFNLLFAVEKDTDDGLSNAYIELDRNFIYDTMMVPELTIFTSNNNLRGGYNTPLDDAAFVTSSKDSIDSKLDISKRTDMHLEDRKQTFISPRASITGSVVVSGLRADKNIDFVFKNNEDNLYVRKTIQSTPGMVAYVYEGKTNGIEDNFKELKSFTSQDMIWSIYTGPTYTGSLLNTNIFINFKAPNDTTILRATTDDNNLVKITNLTTNHYTGPTSGPQIALHEPLSGSGYYNTMITLYGPPNQHWINIDFHDGSWRTFYTASGSIFEETARTDVVDHPDNMSIVDMQVSEDDQQQKFLNKRFTR